MSRGSKGNTPPLFILLPLFLLLGACGNAGDEHSPAEEAESSDQTTEQSDVTQSEEPTLYSVRPAAVGYAFSGDLAALPSARLPGRATTPAVRFGASVAIGSGSNLLLIDIQENRFSGAVEFQSVIRYVAAAPAGIYVVTDDSLSLILDRAREWTRDLPAPVSAVPAVTPGGIYLALDDGALVALGPDGSERYTVALGTVAAGEVIAAGGRLYIAGQDRLITLEAGGGDALWQFETETPPRLVSVSSDHVLLITESGQLFLLEPGTGSRIAWDTDGAGDLWWGAVAGGQVLLLVDNVLSSLSAEEGDELWSVTLDREPFLTPIVTGGMVLIVDDQSVRTISLSGREIDSLSLSGLTFAEPQIAATELLLPLANDSVARIELDGDGTQLPLLDADLPWQLPPDGAFRLADRQVSLRLRSPNGGVYDVSVDSVPGEDLLLTVVHDSGESVATNMGKVNLEPTVRAALEPGVEYELQIVRPTAEGVVEIRVSTEVIE